MPDYDHFSVGDFVRDPFFQQWVIAPQEVHRTFWEDRLTTHPHQQKTVAEAREVLQTLGFRADLTDNADFIAVWEAVYANVRANPQASESSPVSDHRPRRIRRTVAVAASLAGVFFCVFLYLQFAAQEHTIAYTTGYGETKNIVLPDSSRVTLNANSKLWLDDRWSETATADTSRRVWLEGEAFFQVTQRQNLDNLPVKFTVHARDLAISVVGTAFNVSQRASDVRVVLTEGRVEVRNPSKTVNLTMTPGELVEYSAQTQQASQQKVNARVHTAWKENRYVFEDTALEEIIALIENNYGKTVRLETASLKGRKITATIPSTELTVLLNILRETLNINITEEGERIVFRDH